MKPEKATREASENSANKPDKNKKVYSPIKVIDYRVVRPRVFLEKGGNTVASIQQLTSISVEGRKIEFITPNAVTLFYNKGWKEY